MRAITKNVLCTPSMPQCHAVRDSAKQWRAKLAGWRSVLQATTSWHPQKLMTTVKWNNLEIQLFFESISGDVMLTNLGGGVPRCIGPGTLRV